MQELSNNAELRLRFEEDIKTKYAKQPCPSLERVQAGSPHSAGREGKYKDPKVHSMWKGYQLLAANAYREADEHVAGRYIIGKVVGGNKFQFSRVPFHHQSRKQATAEMNRLVEAHNEPFAIFRCVEINNNVLSVEEFAKQKAKLSIQRQIDQLQQELSALN